jgi:hypothetical protein
MREHKVRVQIEKSGQHRFTLYIQYLRVRGVQFSGRGYLLDGLAVYGDVRRLSAEALGKFRNEPAIFENKHKLPPL